MTRTTRLHSVPPAPRGIISRRSLSTLGLTTIVVLATSSKANAFSNRLDDKYNDRPKQRGSQAKDLGYTARVDPTTGQKYTGLKGCWESKPNCFTSSSPPVDPDPLESDSSNPLNTPPIPQWSGGKMSDVMTVLNSYQVGQNGIDGGGYKIIKESQTYVYAQFESYKNGYVDDFEIADIGNGKFDIRSSSRIGYLDYGVNAKRVNYIAKRLRDEFKWDAEGVDLVKRFRNYAILNSQ